MSKANRIGTPNSVYFVTFTVVYWIDAFTRPVYKDMLIENLKFYRDTRGLIIYSFVIMTNHVHLILRSPNEPLSDIIRDYKRWTSRKMRELMQAEVESRRKWMFNLFSWAGTHNTNNNDYQFWQQDNHPKHIYSVPFGLQKLNYIHQNPVKAKIVARAEDYIYSSASNYADSRGIIEVQSLNEMGMW